jgi:hypothetical protein
MKKSAPAMDINKKGTVGAQTDDDDAEMPKLALIIKQSFRKHGAHLPGGNEAAAQMNTKRASWG